MRFSLDCEAVLSFVENLSFIRACCMLDSIKLVVVDFKERHHEEYTERTK